MMVSVKNLEPKLPINFSTNISIYFQYSIIVETEVYEEQEKTKIWMDSRALFRSKLFGGRHR